MWLDVVLLRAVPVRAEGKQRRRIRQATGGELVLGSSGSGGALRQGQTEQGS
jgi:hypothetical protein